VAFVGMKDMLSAAKAAGCAVGAFNVLDYNSTRAVVAAAEELDAPAIIQTSVKTVKFWGAATLSGWVRELAEGAAVPIALHLDHCTSVDVIRTCVGAGWTSVMIDASALPFEENLATTKEVLAAALPAGVDVEAEMGEISGVEDDIAVDESRSRLADPDRAVEFCEGLGLTAFAPAIGTAHGIYKGEPTIDFDRLRTIADRTGLPIALHGGTGLSGDVFRRCIGLGCAKINISTAIKHAFIDGFVKPHEDEAKYDPLALLDSQFAQVKSSVREFIELFGSAGLAQKVRSL
jgi:ketose-bisphosphate aldolase